MKRKNQYTVIWGDPCYHHFVQTVDANEPHEALKEWRATFQDQTIHYPFSTQECKAITQGFEDLNQLSRLEQNLERIMDIKKNNAFTNACYQYIPYTFPGTKNPYLLSYIIKNGKRAQKGKNAVFTFFLYHYQSVSSSQYKAPNLQMAFAQWQKEMLAKSHSEIMPPRVVKRLKAAIIQQAKVNPLSPVVYHPCVWRWHFIAGKSPCTLYIVETDGESPSVPSNDPIKSPTSGQDPYMQASMLMDEENPDKKKVIQLLKAAIKAKDPRAHYALGSWYLGGISPLKKDIKKAIPLLENAAEANIVEAIYELAICYEEGKGVPQNTQRAHQLFLQAALLGDKDAVREVGRTYYYGIGTKKDKKLADIWYEHAKQLGV